MPIGRPSAASTSRIVQVALGVLLVRAVGEVQAEGVRARLVQRAHPLRSRAGRAEGRQDLGGSITVHGSATG